MLRVRGLGFGVLGFLGFWVRGKGFEGCLGFRAYGSRFKVQGSRFKVQD